VAGFCEYCDEPSGSGATELVEFSYIFVYSSQKLIIFFLG
jgi:hypothetical protein